MTKDRRAATLIGVLYIIGTAAGVAGAMIMPSSAAGTDTLAQIAAHRDAAIAGALLILTMGFSLSALAAVFYPIGRRFSEALSMGYVIFRGALEGMIYVISALIWLVLIALSSQPSLATASIAGVLQTSQDVIWNQLVSLPFGIGALMFYWLLYRANLVPRWILVWGFVSAPLFMAANLVHIFGGNIDVVMASLFLQEMVLAVWLIAKGFNLDAAGRTGDARAQSADACGPGRQPSWHGFGCRGRCRMSDKFFVPIAAMLAGLGLWVLFMIARALSSNVRAWSPTAEAGLCLAAGGLIVFSGVR